jgi:hypothetical protein
MGMRLLEVELLLREKLPRVLADLVIAFATTPAPWDPYDLWVPEYDSNGDYGHVPMCPVELPLFA